MNRTEYNMQLDLLDEALDAAQPLTDDIWKQIEAMYDYKPVSTRYYQIRCKALMKKGTNIQLIDEFKDRISKDCAYEDNLKLWNQLIELYYLTGQETEGRRQQYLLNKLLQKEEYLQEEDKLAKIRERFMSGRESRETLLELETMYYITCNRLMAYCVYLYRVHRYPGDRDEERESFYIGLDNMAYLSECFADRTRVILVNSAGQKENYDVLIFILDALQIPVSVIMGVEEIEGDYDLKASVSVTMENQQVYQDGSVLWAVSKKKNGTIADSNIPYVIEHVCKTETEDNFCIVLAENEVLEELRSHRETGRNFERLSMLEAEQIENEIGFAWAGDYYSYISRLYRHDVREWVDREPECMFSIVVPVRNITGTLEHTLRTCLEQDFKGDYEIVLSDNSTDGNTAAYELWKRINNEKLKYYKPPRDLRLAKSFEYAYLQTRGKYIIPIGADDGMLPWSLEVLAVLWNQYPESEILLWDRGFYAWPGFNGGQQNELIIPARYDRRKLSHMVRPAESYVEMLKQNPQNMYALPNLYLNSGFKRSYMKALYEKTGRLWDGNAQDIWMGVQNTMLNKELLYLNYPITIAGMSNASVGALSSAMDKKNTEEEKKTFKNLIGGKGICSYVCTRAERSIPFMRGDVADLWRCMARASAKGIGAVHYEPEEQKRMLKSLYDLQGILSDNLDKFIQEGYGLELMRTEEMKAWYEENIASMLSECRLIPKKQLEQWEQEKKYREGFQGNGGVILDASRYDVTNIYEAVQLFKSFLGF